MMRRTIAAPRRTELRIDANSSAVRDVLLEGEPDRVRDIKPTPRVTMVCTAVTLT